MSRHFVSINIIIVLLLASTTTWGAGERHKHASIAITSSEISNDEAGAVSIASPFYHDTVQARFSVAQAYKGGVKSGVYAWYDYKVYNLGIAAVLREVPDLLRVYAEGGLTHIDTDSSLSMKQATMGRYALVGVELYLNPDSWLNCCSAYIELGSTGKGAKAEQLDTQPVIGHGFVSTAGLRYYF